MQDNANFEEKKIGLLFKIHVYSNAIFDIITVYLFYKRDKVHDYATRESLNLKFMVLQALGYSHQSELESVHAILQGV